VPTGKAEPFFRTPLGIVVLVGLFILFGEFLIMVAIEVVFTPLFQRQVSAQFWEFADPVALSIIVAPALYYGVLRPMAHAHELLRWQNAELSVAAATFETQAGVIITDARGVIIRVNDSFTALTGYQPAQVIGKTPMVLRSQRQNKEFYRLMWQTIQRENHWKGEIWDRRSDGSLFPASLTISAVLGENGEVINYVGILIDITAQKAAENEVKSLAFYDPLTQLPNRRLLLERLRLALAGFPASPRGGALFFIDLDNFKMINDSRGHDVGDQLLRQVAQRLSGCVRKSDTVARLGGDEFVILAQDLSEAPQEAASQVEVMGEKILGALNHSYSLAGTNHYCTPSIGVTLLDKSCESVEDVLKQADLAMYKAKISGRNQLRFFDPAMQAMVETRMNMEAELRTAISERQFVVHYQPQVDLAGKLVGAEALVRWRHPVRGLLLPGDFITLAEDTGLIVPLGLWVLETACRQMTLWRAQPLGASFSMAVNVSAPQLQQKDFVAQLLAVIDKCGADPRGLTLELTESLMMADIDQAIDKITQIKARGVRISMDDFGTGYSSLSMLKRLPLDQLKIDRSFVSDMLVEPDNAAIARTIIALAQTLDLAVIAEGVESEEQRTFLAAHGCREFQGYLVGRPAPAEIFEQAWALAQAGNEVAQHSDVDAACESAATGH